MTKGAKKAAWIVGLLAGAAGIGGAVYYATRPKQIVSPQGTRPPTSGDGAKPNVTTISPTAVPGVYAAFAPYSPNVSWVDEHGNQIGGGGSNGGGGGVISATRS